MEQVMLFGHVVLSTQINHHKLYDNKIFLYNFIPNIGLNFLFFLINVSKYFSNLNAH